MTQCHDPYEPKDWGSGLHVVRDRSPEAAGCHDPYAMDFALPAWAQGGHGCEVREVRRGEVCILRLTGRLDWMTASEFASFVCSECADPGVVIDLTDAEVDAAGTGALLKTAADRRRHHRQLVVVVADGPGADALRDAGFDEVAGVAPTEAAALGRLRDEGVDIGPAARGRPHLFAPA